MKGGLKCEGGEQIFPGEVNGSHPPPLKEPVGTVAIFNLEATKTDIHTKIPYEPTHLALKRWDGHAM